eukprot:292692-Prymnesium_polylepis.1
MCVANFQGASCGAPCCAQFWLATRPPGKAGPPLCLRKPALARGACLGRPPQEQGTVCPGRPDWPGTTAMAVCHGASFRAAARPFCKLLRHAGDHFWTDR